MPIQRSLVPTFLLSASLLSGGVGYAADVHFVSGDVIEPQDLNEGVSLDIGDRVRTGTDGIVVIEYRWRSDQEGFDCQQLAVFGFGASHTVADVATPGRCNIGQAQVPESGGQSFSERDTRYAEPKFDMGAPPARVRESWQRAQAFDRWMQQAYRNFTGRVEGITNGQVTVRPASGGRSRRFSLAPGALSGHASPTSLRNKRVSVTWQARMSGPVAVGIESLEPAVIAAPVAAPVSPPVAVATQPAANPQPQPAPAARRTRNWICKLDLHNGDVGVLMLQVTGAAVGGAIVVDGTTDKQTIRGSYSKGRIDFIRQLSPTSSQPFAGVVVRSGARSLAMGGRYAANYAGTWSADCQIDAN